MHPLFHYINKHSSTQISKEDFDIVFNHFVPNKIRKRQYLLQKGEICEHFIFITKGAFRQYYLDEKDVERIVNLYVEDCWTVDYDSFMNFTPSLFYIDAWEDGEVLYISKKNILKLCEETPAFKELLLNLIIKSNIATQRRITSINLSAKKRYNWFVETYPFFVNRFPQHVIASYLGITKDTLSRLLKK
ncbi:Crp/Fnr family transcriptional regulator [Sphingobacterium sp. SYP-B4668]|uniref:Crp/Fnr family transcriptional regulator n=1 Tax=Sphingobacterium sp. SYP-B4668 TaxID=2996035 RepID=UPI0022DE7057|nr:Crp/Fnr family transcriptional regulator [Sphingobacterium sp. SYP-B4668]